MSGAILYPPCRADCDTGVLYIEVSGCLPMCGHGTIGTVTFALEQGLVSPREEGRLRLDTPAGLVIADYERAGRLSSARAPDQRAELSRPGGGSRSAARSWASCSWTSPMAAISTRSSSRSPTMPGSTSCRRATSSASARSCAGGLNEQIEVVHPEDPTIQGVSHMMWTGPARDLKAHGRNAVFYGEKAIDRSPCGTGTSARIAQLAARGKLAVGDEFVHESIIGSLFEGHVEEPPGWATTTRSCRAWPAGRA